MDSRTTDGWTSHKPLDTEKFLTLFNQHFVGVRWWEVSAPLQFVAKQGVSSRVTQEKRKVMAQDWVSEIMP